MDGFSYFMFPSRGFSEFKLAAKSVECFNGVSGSAADFVVGRILRNLTKRGMCTPYGMLSFWRLLKILLEKYGVVCLEKKLREWAV